MHSLSHPTANPCRSFHVTCDTWPSTQHPAPLPIRILVKPQRRAALHSSQWATFAACAHHEWHGCDDLSADRQAFGGLTRHGTRQTPIIPFKPLRQGLFKPAPRRREGLHSWWGRPWTPKPAPVLITFD